jgi:hypothetical protein
MSASTRVISGWSISELAERLAVARVMDRLGERQPHHAGRGHRAIEPRQRHHVDDGGDALAGLADQPGGGVVELDFGGRVGAVAELVLEPHQRMPLRLPSGR